MIARRFALWRIAFGVYLAFYYWRMLPFVIELYSRAGLLKAHEVWPASFLPLWILECDSARTVYLMNFVAILMALLLAAGFQRRFVSAILFVIETWQACRNPMTHFSPHAAYVDWLLAACVLIPQGEPWSFQKKDPRWRIPAPLTWGAWAILAVGYTYSFQGKLAADSKWLQGSALYYLLNFDSARDLWYGSFFLHFPAWSLYIPNWIGLFLEAFGPVMILFRRARAYWFIGMTAFHVTILIVFDLPQLTLGMLLFHAFIATFYLEELRSVWAEDLRRFAMPKDALMCFARNFS